MMTMSKEDKADVRTLIEMVMQDYAGATLSTAKNLEADECKAAINAVKAMVRGCYALGKELDIPVESLDTDGLALLLELDVE